MTIKSVINLCKKIFTRKSNETQDTSQGFATTPAKKSAATSSNNNTNTTVASFDNPRVLTRDQHPVSRQ